MFYFGEILLCFGNRKSGTKGILMKIRAEQESNLHQMEAIKEAILKRCFAFVSGCAMHDDLYPKELGNQ